MVIPSGRICAVITEHSTVDAASAIREAGRQADLVELRLDYLRDFDFTNPEELRPLIEVSPLPVIITCRAVSEGGVQQVDDQTRLSLLVEGARWIADYCDIEAAYYDQAMPLSPDLSRLIVSYHNFTETPSDLNAIYRRICSRRAAIHKIVTRARSVIDSLPILNLLSRSVIEGHPLIAIAMETPGAITRLIGPSFGSFLTYASLLSGRESAPGQITCKEMRDLYRVNRLSKTTTITGIIGLPISHSVSPAMHNTVFGALGLDYVYLPIEVEDAGQFLRRFVRLESREIDWSLRGLSVTIPHKTTVVPLMDDLHESAQRTGAVNTIVIENGRLVGHNTDALGAIQPLEKFGSLKGERCAVLGAGGAARAVVSGLIVSGASVTVLARDSSRARQLAESFGVDWAPLDAIDSQDAGIIINATPVGMSGYDERSSPVRRESLRGRKIAYDLVYNPIETKFLKDARSEGCTTISGLEMLVAQAAAQFELWTGVRAPAELMRNAALERLGR